MALIVEARYEKDAILEAYLNEIYLGQRGSTAVHGVGEASHFLFGKDVRDLALPRVGPDRGDHQEPERALPPHRAGPRPQAAGPGARADARAAARRRRGVGRGPRGAGAGREGHARAARSSLLPRRAPAAAAGLLRVHDAHDRGSPDLLDARPPAATRRGPARSRSSSPGSRRATPRSHPRATFGSRPASSRCAPKRGRFWRWSVGATMRRASSIAARRRGVRPGACSSPSCTPRPSSRATGGPCSRSPRGSTTSLSSSRPRRVRGDRRTSTTRTTGASRCARPSSGPTTWRRRGWVRRWASRG